MPSRKHKTTTLQHSQRQVNAKNEAKIKGKAKSKTCTVQNNAVRPNSATGAKKSEEISEQKKQTRYSHIAITVAIIGVLSVPLWDAGIRKYFVNQNEPLFKTKEIESVTNLISKIHAYPIFIKQFFTKDFCFLTDWGKTDDCFYQSQPSVVDLFIFAEKYYIGDKGGIYLQDKKLTKAFRPISILTAEQFHKTADSFVVNGKKYWKFETEQVSAMTKIDNCRQLFQTGCIFLIYCVFLLFF